MWSSWLSGCAGGAFKAWYYYCDLSGCSLEDIKAVVRTDGDCLKDVAQLQRGSLGFWLDQWLRLQVVILCLRGIRATEAVVTGCAGPCSVSVDSAVLLSIWRKWWRGAIWQSTVMPQLALWEQSCTATDPLTGGAHLFDFSYLSITIRRYFVFGSGWNIWTVFCKFILHKSSPHKLK